jgi:hypothetical protein
MDLLVYANMLNPLHPNTIADALGAEIVTKPRKADWLLVVGGGLNCSKQIAEFQRLGAKVAMLWMGEDVYRAVHDEKFRDGIPAVDKHLVVHDRLKFDLASIALNSSVVPFFTPRHLTQLVSPPSAQRSICSYLPSVHPKFMLRQFTEVALACPDVEFKVYGNKKELHLPKNCIEYGWLDDPMEVVNLIQHSGALLRMTRHDGFPQNIIEAKMLQKNVISNYPYYGCLSAEDTHGIIEIIERNLWSRPDTVSELWYMQNCTATAFKKRMFEVLDG